MQTPFNRKQRPHGSQDARTAQPRPNADEQARAVRTLSRLVACLGALAVGAVVFAIATTASANARLSAFEGDVTSVCVASVAVPAGTVLQADMLRTEEVPAAHVAEDALTSAEEAAGLVTLAPISANGQVTSSVVATEGNVSSLANAIDPGLQAISVAVDAESGLAGLIRQGDHVDVLAEGRTVVQDATVLAVDASLAEAQDEYATVTVQVSPEDARALQSQQDIAPVRFVMRAAADRKPAAPEETTDQDAAAVPPASEGGAA